MIVGTVSQLYFLRSIALLFTSVHIVFLTGHASICAECMNMRNRPEYFLQPFTMRIWGQKDEREYMIDILMYEMLITVMYACDHAIMSIFIMCAIGIVIGMRIFIRMMARNAIVQIDRGMNY